MKNVFRFQFLRSEYHKQPIAYIVLEVYGSSIIYLSNGKYVVNKYPLDYRKGVSNNQFA